MSSDVASIRQVGLVSAGCQPWLHNLVVGNGPRFAYCATLAVYIYEFDRRFGTYHLSSINAEHKKPIVCISWNKRNPDLIATACAEHKICVWDVTKRKIIAQLISHSKGRGPPICLDWMPFASNQRILSFSCSHGVLKSWDITTKNAEEHNEIPSLFKEHYIVMFRWHHNVPQKIAFGHTDGSLTLHSPTKKHQHVLRPIKDEDKCYDDPVVALEWDPLSNDYLLVCSKISGIRLIDSDGCFLVSRFSLPSRAISTFTLSWIHSAPGMFLTGDRESGVLRLWSVSQNKPLDSFKLKQTGFNCLYVLDEIQSSNELGKTSGTSGQNQSNHSENVSAQSNCSIPPASVVCTFVDGGVGLYNLHRKKWQFLRDYGHVETIFDCKFKPDNPRLLATASFDGTVKVWSVNDLKAEKTSAGNEGVIYSISWAPGDLDCIVCGTRQHGIFVWDYKKEKVIKRFREHGTKAVFCVAWNQRDSFRIASCSEDTFW